LDAGGAERSLLELLRRLDRTRFAPTVCSFHPGGALRSEFDQLGLPILSLDGLGRHELRGVRLPAILARVRPAIIHSRLVLPNLWARLLGHAFRAKVITEERSTGAGRQGWVSRANRLTGRWSDVEVANSDAVAEFMRQQGGVPAHRLKVIAGGVDTVRFTLRDGLRDIDVLSVGRVESYKGVDEFLEAARLLPHAKVLLAGTGSLLATATEFVTKHALSGRVELAGNVSDVPALLGRARVFVNASHDEGLPNAVMEAMSCGLPVVATDIPGHRPLVLPGRTGTLVPARNARALAEAVARYLADPELAAAHGRAGREHVVAHFSFDRVAREYEALYESLLGDA
jgi:glycosyltransferase involved in cell wall biosynthesis